MSGAAPVATVAVITYNGAGRLPACLHALSRQTIAEHLQVLVVDDASGDDSAAVAAAHGVRVVRRARNGGPAAARNTCIREAGSDLVLCIDDDCIAAPDWAERLVAAWDGHAVAVGGGFDIITADGYVGGYLRRHHPFLPLERGLEEGARLGPRLAAYLGARARPRREGDAREVAALPGGNVALSRRAVAAAGWLDERMPSGEDLDICRRLSQAFPGRPLRFVPDARVGHVTSTRLRLVLRRARGYGRGAGFAYAHRRVRLPTVFPAPVLVAGLLAAGLRRPRWAVVAVLAPLALFPAWLRHVRRAPAAVADPYLTLGIEAAHDVGVLDALRRGAAT